MRQIFKIFFKADGTRPFLVLFCLLLGGLAEAVGIGTLLPLVTAILDPSKGSPSVFEQAVQNTFATIGVEPSFANMIVMIVSIMFVRSALLFAAMSYAGITAARVSIYFRRKIIKAIFAAKWRYYANQSTGRLATSLGNDSTRAGEAYLSFATAAAKAVQILAYAAVAMFINWRVAFAGIFAGLFIAFVSQRLVKIAKRSGFKMTDRIGIMTADTVDMLHNIKALKSMNRYDALLIHLDSILKRLKKSLYAQSLSKYGLVYGNDFLVALLVGGGAYLAFAYGGVPLPQLMVFGILFFQVISYAAKLQKEIQAASIFQGAYERVSEVLNTATIEKEVIPGTTRPDIGSGIVMQNINFSHGTTAVLKDLSLNIPTNSITVIQGPSGAGKTTLLDLLVGFHRPDSGVIKVGNTDLADIDLQSWRSSIGYVPQELSLFHDTVTENITLYDETLTPDAIAKSVQLSGVAGFIDKLPNGLDTDVGEFGGKLSGGQRQRISLARALVSNPKVLILDEVTSALDPDTEAAIVKNIDALRGQYTIIAITHRPAWTQIADQLYTLKDGKALLQKNTSRKNK
jgi:ATP-binding cassette, subfamily C, bacterial